jgi:Uma2 family endonuclease
VVAHSTGRGETGLELDQRIILHRVPWSHYEILLAVRGDAPVPRIAYCEGELELMSPSLDHEMIKSRIRQLIEAYAALVGIDLWPAGSWTVRSAPKDRGVEPDECYTLGDPRGRARPDLAIEVIWTSGGLDKLDIYCGLEVPEVWLWRDGAIRVFVLHEGRYAESPDSPILPGLEVSLIAELATSSPADALQQLRARYPRQG